MRSSETGRGGASILILIPKLIHSRISSGRYESTKVYFICAAKSYPRVSSLGYQIPVPPHLSGSANNTKMDISTGRTRKPHEFRWKRKPEKKNVSRKSRGSSPEKKKSFKETSNYTRFPTYPLIFESFQLKQRAHVCKVSLTPIGNAVCIASADPYTSLSRSNFGVTMGQ
jgi:hypothetical protein